MQNLEQHYKALGLEPGASLEEVNQAYKDLVFIWHPDRVPQENERLIKKSVEKIQEINQARDSLRSYHRKQKKAPAKPQSKPKAYSSQSYYSDRQAYQQGNSAGNHRAYRSYSDPKNRQQTYSRPHYEQTKSYRQPPYWNYRDYYSTPNNPGQSSNKDGYRDFRQSSKSYVSSSPVGSSHKRPYYKDLRGADLSRSNFKERDFSGRDLSQADLSYADLSDTFLHKIVLEGANLQGANLKGANLLQANLRNANLKDANLIGADLSGSDLSGANLSGAKVGFNNKIMVKITAVKLTGATLPDGSIHP
ncbi:pentapeptide repeat-containing protein [Pleurocapsales cyanobacterium LEGE 10410]|nr:pentapeptide repeat-containing protein [Pleurocapsales cyanobacterium LEGE 10410]